MGSLQGSWHAEPGRPVSTAAPPARSPPQYETVPVKCTTGPLPPIVPWLVPLPVMPLNWPVPPVISQVLAIVAGYSHGLAVLPQTVPGSARVIEPVAPLKVIWPL